MRKNRNLSEEQKEHVKNVHERHVACNGTERQKNMAIVDSWVDENGCVCVELENGEWYHYYADGSWG
jgi:hypothetical protein